MPSMPSETYAVIGLGGSGQAIAAELLSRGRTVVVCDPESNALVSTVRAQGGLVRQAESGPEALFPVAAAMIDPAEAVAAAGIVIVAMQADHQEALLRGCAHAFRPDHLLLLVPGGVGGALLAAAIARDAGTPDLIVCQVAVMPYSSRMIRPGAIAVTGRKLTVPLGIFPGRRTQEALARLAPGFHELTLSRNVLENGLGRPAIGLHPVPMIMNAAKIEQNESFRYDGYDITPSVARVIDAVDLERLALLRALGVPDAVTFTEILGQFYGVSGDSFYEAVHKVRGYKDVHAPDSLHYRYLTEDVPTQTVPAAFLAKAFGVEAPLLEAIIAFTNAMHGTDYRRTGWNAEKLGLDGLDGAEILQLVQDGPRAK